MRNLKFIIPPLIALLFIVGYEVFFTPPQKTPTRRELILIRPDTNARQASLILAKRGIIKSQKRFLLLARLFGFDKRIQPGRYLLPSHLNELGVLKIITSARYAQSRVTIPEGLTLKEVARILESNGVCKAEDFLACARNSKGLALPAQTVEGYLFPDTYDLPVGLDPQKTIEIMVNRFFEVFNGLKKELGVGSINIEETVILASLIEKEAKLDSERPIIASVFTNRLKNGMRLECCSTVEYILPEHKPVLTYADLRTPSPYNAYLHPGLPPGPICNPGRASLKAALRPAQTDFLYFVSQGDGSHRFSKNLAEHNQAKKRKKRYTNISNESK